MHTDTRHCVCCEAVRCVGSQYCVAHKCRRRCQHKRAGLSEFCTSHKCQACDGASAYGCSFCLAHKCRNEDCFARRDKFSEYCIDHHCKSCSAERLSNSAFCPAHKCNSPSCVHERASPSEYCNAHIVRTDPAEAQRIRIGRYEIQRVLGSGSFSQVRLGLDTKSQSNVAVKVINLAALKEMCCEDLLGSEIFLLQNLSHPNVIGTVDSLRTKKSIFIVMEYLSGGELFDVISSQGILPGPVAQRYFKDLLKGICYLHAHSVAHRDIKPENLLLQGDTLKIADLGFAAYQHEGKHLTEALGTPEYQAPEVVPRNPYNGFAADMWSCGIVLFTMAQAVLPFDGQGDDFLLARSIKAGISVPDDVPDGPRELIKALVVSNPLKRPTAHELLWNCKDNPIYEWSSLTEEERGNAPIVCDLALSNHVAPPAETTVSLTSLPQVESENESSLFTAEERSTWTLTKLLEGAVGIFEAFGGGASPDPPKDKKKLMPQRALVRPQNRWRRGGL